MARQGTQLAKLSRPRLHGVVFRQRLFEHLDAAAVYPVTWVSGPPGAGKTTLVASYLESRKLPGIWYQVDSGDSDPATFFFYLGLAERARAKRRKDLSPLPLFTPEYISDLSGFSRRFFRELFSRLGTDAVLVLDNYQEGGEQSPFEKIVLEGMQEAPAGMRVIVVSRISPPEYLARLRANRLLVQITAELLHLSFDESRDIARAHIDIDDASLRRLHEQASGWMAGLILLIERLRRGTLADAGGAPDRPDEVFDYFAAELFDNAVPDIQRALLQLSYLPRTTAAEAEQLTGDRGAGKLLDHLYRRHLFTDRRGGQELTYQFHALFRSFLQHRARATLTSGQQRGLCRRAAQILDQAGYSEEAMSLLLEVSDLSGVQTILLRDAARLIGQGRWKQVVDWIERLPAEQVNNNRWLLHWLGSAQIAAQPSKARELLERCHALAKADGDLLCELHAAAGVVQTHMMQYREFRPFDRWIPVLEQVFTAEFALPTFESELRILSAFFVALSYRNPIHPRLPTCRERMFELVQTGADFPLRLNAAFYLLFHGATTGLLNVAHRAEPVLLNLLLHPEVTALNAGVCWFALSWYYCRAGRYRDCEEALARVGSIAEHNGLTALQSSRATIAFWMELQRGNLEAAEEWSRRLDDVMIPGHLYSEASNHGIKGWLAVLRNSPDEAIRHVTQACRLFDELGSHMHRIIYRSEIAWAEIAKRDFPAAQRWIDEARQIAGEDTSFWAKPIFFAAEAWMALLQDNPLRAGERVSLALATMREQGHDFTLLQHRHPCVAELLSFALEIGAEAEYATKLICLYRLAPPDDHRQSWPWPVKVHALGRFDLLVDGKQVSFTGKVPKKPLMLLKVLLCFGPRGANDWQIMDALWPDDDGDMARDAFRTTLHRLRKLLGRSECVEFQDGQVRLNQELCWVDAWEFARAAESGDAERNAPGTARLWLSLYCGPLLPTDAGQRWASAARDRLSSRFVRCAEREAVALEELGELNQAMQCYERAIDAEPCAEGLYHGLMRCLHRAGRHADMARTYAQLEHNLALTLDCRPSEASVELYHRLRSTLALETMASNSG